MKDKKLYTVLQPDDSKAVRYAAGDSEYPNAKGKLYKKRIINFGEYADQWFPEYFLHLDEAWGESVLQNFKDGTVGRVYVPASHTDDPDKNRGEVIDMMLSADGAGIDAILDIRDEETVEKIEADLIWDVSIGFTMNWITKEGDEKGPAIYHVALVNNPYIEDMTPFEAFAKVTAECRAEVATNYGANAIMLSRSGIKKELSKESDMDKVKIINDKEYPVEVTFREGDEDKTVTVEAGAEVEVPADQKEVVETLIAESTAPEEEETDEEREAREKKEKEDADAAAAEEEGTKAELAKAQKQIQEYRKKEVDQEYEKLLKAGKIVPAQEKAFKALAMSGDVKVEFSKDGKSTQVPVSEMLKEFTKHAPKVVNYSEDGGNGGGAGGEGVDKDATPYDKLSAEAKAGLQATGVSKERYNDNVAKHPEMYPDVTADNKKEDEE